MPHATRFHTPRPAIFHPRATCSTPYSLYLPAACDIKELELAQQKYVDLSVFPAGLLVLLLLLTIAYKTRFAFTLLRPSPDLPTPTLPVKLSLCNIQLIERLSREKPAIITHFHAGTSGAAC